MVAAAAVIATETLVAADAACADPLKIPTNPNLARRVAAVATLTLALVVTTMATELALVLAA